jgi:hypothetical protein
VSDDWIDPRERVDEETTSSAEWPEPVPFPADNIDAAPSFPSHVLPKAALDVVRAVSRFVQVDESLVAQNVLGIGSFPITHKVVVAEGSWCEEANLWAVSPADSGERKSATLRLIVRPVRRVERERREAERGQIANEEADLELLEQQYAAAVKKAAKEENEVERLAAETEVRELALQLSDAKEGRTRRTRMIVDDVTPEFFGRELAENNPLLFANAEGGLLDNFINRYQNIPNLDLLNQSYTGDDYSPGRSTRNADPVERPLACFALSPQPIVVAGLATNPVLVARGTLSRFLYWFVPPLAGTRSVDTQDLDHGAVDAWEQRIRELLSLPAPGDEPYRVQMSDAAIAAMRPYRQQVEDALLRTDGAAMRAWLNRARGHAQRLALVLHVLEHGVDALTREIAAQHAEAAVELMRAYEEHAAIAFDLMDESPLLKRSRTMLGWLKARSASVNETITVREAHRSHQRWGSVKECREVLVELDGRGWIALDGSAFFAHPILCKASDTDDRSEEASPESHGSQGSEAESDDGLSPVSLEMQESDDAFGGMFEETP